MAWNDIEAKDDPDLWIQVYYARLNVLQGFLSGLSRDLLIRIWESTSSQPMSELRRTAIAGTIVAELIQMLNMQDLECGDIGVGDWFVHTGVTRYSPSEGGHKRARIKLRSGREIVAVTRQECELTATASVNMSEDDDVSFVVGRLLSKTKFDLVAAGYREPSFGLMAGEGREIDFSQKRTDIFGTTAGRFLKMLPEVAFTGIDDQALLFRAISDSFDRFKHAIVYEGVWKQLYDPNMKPAHESRHQGLYRLCANFAFSALRIQVHPEADHGSGETDLTVTLRDACTVIEFKKDRELREIKHGLNVQLPRYMKSARTVHGAYFVMCHERTPEDVEQILSGIKDDIPADCTIYSDVADCRPRKSASIA